jgi:D-glycero-alpha-D-manno-heptose 1-phosphate guanylyltransferase
MIPVLVLAGGLGTRLQNEVKDVPKPMAPIQGIPFLHYVITHIETQYSGKIYFSLGYKGELIKQYFTELNPNSYTFYNEPEALGTGGAIKFCWQNIPEEQLLVINGDTFAPFDVKTFILHCKTHHLNSALLLRPVENCSRYGSVEFNSHFKITRFKEKHQNTGAGWINAGIYLLNKTDFFKHCSAMHTFSLEQQYLAEHPQLGAYPSTGYFIDIGIPEDFKKAQNELSKYKP